MQPVLLIDNYDSFSYNLVHLLEAEGAKVTVRRNDEFDERLVSRFHKIVLSPGPGLPSESGDLLQLIRDYSAEKSILGICLGHQAIAEVFGGKLVNLNRPFHGVEGNITITDDSETLFRGMESQQKVGRYHSWMVADPLPETLLATSIGTNGEIMSLRHQALDVRGVQFHPESILTPHGRRMLSNWLGN